MSKSAPKATKRRRKSPAMESLTENKDRPISEQSTASNNGGLDVGLGLDVGPGLI
jgi:hypothetical protein